MSTTAQRAPPAVLILLRLLRVIGALLFAVALAGTGYVWLRVWPVVAPRASGIGLALLVNAALFAMFAAHHSVFARSRVKRWLAGRLPEAMLRPLYVALASLMLLLTVFGWRAVGHVIYAASGWSGRLLQLAQVGGALLIVSAARVIDPLELAGLRPAADSRLEIRGAYRLVRHPIYLGFLLIAWTPTTMTVDRVWFALLSTLYLALAIPWEERSLRRLLGAAYDAYRARVRWRVIPGLY